MKNRIISILLIVAIFAALSSLVACNDNRSLNEIKAEKDYYILRGEN